MNWNRPKPVFSPETRADRKHEALVNAFLNQPRATHNKSKPSRRSPVKRASPTAEVLAAIEENRTNPDPPWDVDPAYKPISKWPR
jgi:hypothetical protein